MQVKFFLANGAIVDWPVPEGHGFAFAGFCSAIRAAGYFQSDNVYIRHDQITAIGLDTGGTFPVVMQGAPVGGKPN